MAETVATGDVRKMQKKDSKATEIEIPDTIYDLNTNTAYKKGRFFGKGGFAKCYEIKDPKTNRTYAGKIVPKKMVSKENQREKMTQEITIHRELKHKHVVGFYSFFEDSHHVYIVLELCRRRSMMELHRRRKTITELETRYYMSQILHGVNYLHSRRIIHRDLKLGNLFLNDDLHVKIGDFGLATKLTYDGERKKTLCGTPNYIAPEILNKQGHSFEVDIWSIGCIMYTLLMGKPPFETETLRETYTKIKKCDYTRPTRITTPAHNMIVMMLQSDPKRRPNVSQLLAHEFIVSGVIPQSLPASCLTMEPRADQWNRKPLGEITIEDNMDVDTHSKATRNNSGAPNDQAKNQVNNHHFDGKKNYEVLRALLQQVLSAKKIRREELDVEMSDPAAQPLVWVSKWVDYSDKYGFGYQLCDDSVGVMFNDATKLIMLPNGVNVHYTDRHGKESYHTLENYPKPMDKKMKLLSYFSRYMREHLLKAGASIERNPDPLSRIPHLNQWCRSTNGVLMQLNNGTVQVNFTDHTKIIMCPLMSAITYIDESKRFITYWFSSIEKNGCSSALYDKMRYACDKIAILIEQEREKCDVLH